MSDLNDEQRQELYSWIDNIPLSRQKKNITRDFSDGVLTAEVIHHFVPRLVDLHNYSPANATRQKAENWRLLNSKLRHINCKQNVCKNVSITLAWWNVAAQGYQHLLKTPPFPIAGTAAATATNSKKYQQKTQQQQYY